MLLPAKQNQAKADAKRASGSQSGRAGVMARSTHPKATGSIGLIDAGGLKYFINTNITFSTSSSASGAASEASYQAPIVASTMGGGTVMSALNDSYDGYQAMCVSLTNATGPCATGNAAYTMYNKRGPATLDATCANRQIIYPAQTIGPLSVRRKAFVPTNDRFIRWVNFYTNTSGAPVTFTTITSNNLGSDSNTVIVNSSNGDAVAQPTDTWVTTFQNWSGSTSTDPRLGHILQGPGASTPVTTIFFANGNDTPYWGYAITLAPGQTKAIMNFGIGFGTKASAATQAARLVTLPATTTQCLSATELSQITNFATSADLSITKSTTATQAFGTAPVTYTIAVSNAGPSTASSVSVSDTLAAGAVFVSASGSGWTCNNVANVVTCTLPSLAVGAAPPITLTFNAPPTATTTTLANTATVSSATNDPNPANNSSTSTIPLLPVGAIPAMSPLMLALLALSLCAIAIVIARAT
jgi:uncharacterized repeat protein (TIGR01451 family)